MACRDPETGADGRVEAGIKGDPGEAEQFRAVGERLPGCFRLPEAAARPTGGLPERVSNRPGDAAADRRGQGSGKGAAPHRAPGDGCDRAATGAHRRELPSEHPVPGSVGRGAPLAAARRAVDAHPSSRGASGCAPPSPTSHTRSTGSTAHRTPDRQPRAARRGRPRGRFGANAARRRRSLPRIAESGPNVQKSPPRG